MKKKRTPNPLRFGYEPDPFLAKEQIKEMVRSLNKPMVKIGSNARRVPGDLSEIEKELRRLVESWMASGPNLNKMFKEEPELRLRTRQAQANFWPTPTGRGYLDGLVLSSEEKPPSPKDDALRRFMTLITNPYWELLGGPCARCKDYYVKKTKRQKVYCSRTCSSRATAVPAIKQKRQQVQDEKIFLAQKFIAEWRRRAKGRRPEWKRWVSMETGYSIQWLSRAANNGRLQKP
jgi:hypothetical protein